MKIESKEDFWRVQIEAIYRRRNPHKFKEVGGLMEKYKGKEMQLYVKVCKHYDLNPKKLYAQAAAAPASGGRGMREATTSGSMNSCAGGNTHESVSGPGDSIAKSHSGESAYAITRSLPDPPPRFKMFPSLSRPI